MSKSKVMSFGLLAVLFLSAGFAGFGSCASAAGQEDFVVNEIMYNPGSGVKWMEMVSEKDISFELDSNGQIKNFYLATKKNKSTGVYTSYVVYSQNGITHLPKGTFVIFTNNPDALNVDFPDDAVILKASTSFDFLLSDSSTNYASVSYSNDNKLTWHEDFFYGAYGKTAQGYSLERLSGADDEWQESYIAGGTPGYENFTGKDMFKDDSEDDVDEAACNNSSAEIRFNEFFPYSETGKQEYIEIKNFDENCIDLSGWRIEDSGGHKYVFPAGTTIESEEVLPIEKDFYLNNTTPETVHLFDTLGEQVDAVSYDRAIKNYSFSFDGEAWVWTSILTPGEENRFDEDEADNESADNADFDGDSAKHDIRFNELLPNPKGDEKTDEYVELYNGEKFDINLENWIIKDTSKTKFIFPRGYIIKSGQYLTVYRSAYKFTLNNGGPESVYLSDPDGNMISKVDYENSKEDLSYGFDGKDWRWSKSQTPGKKNKFGASPKIKFAKIKTGYVGIPVSFDASIRSDKKSKKKKKDEAKYHWDFGDGKKSYLQNVNHIFQKTGKYRINLSVDNGVEDVNKSFKIEIRKYPKVAVEITGILPNPADSDTGKEWVEIKNNSRKAINLKGWRIATGQKALVNHVISGDVSVDPGKTAQLTRQDALFFLNNKSATLELRYPNGKTASRLTYEKDKIAEGEICRSVNGLCNWTAPEKEDENDDMEDGADGSEGEIESTGQKTDTANGSNEPESRQETIAGAQGNEISSDNDSSLESSASEEVGKKPSEEVAIAEQEKNPRMIILIEKVGAAINVFVNRIL